MFAANLYNIHLATVADEASLIRLAGLDGGRRLRQPVLVGEIGGETAAAMSLADGRSVADPQRRTDHLLACLRVRADALAAYEATPSLPTRMLAAVSARNHASTYGADRGTPGQRSATATTRTNRRISRRPVRPKASAIN